MNAPLTIDSFAGRAPYGTLADPQGAVASDNTPSMKAKLEVFYAVTSIWRVDGCQYGRTLWDWAPRDSLSGNRTPRRDHCIECHGGSDT